VNAKALCHNRKAELVEVPSGEREHHANGVSYFGFDDEPVESQESVHANFTDRRRIP
jgi:hypothetical protein